MYLIPLTWFLSCTPDGKIDDSGAGGDGGDGGGTACAETAAGLPDCVDGARYQADLELVAAARPPGSDHWQEVQDLCADRFTAMGMAVERHIYATGVNVIGRMEGTAHPEEQILISAHYDHIDGCPGADDNGTGVAALLESARVLAEGNTERSLVFACWDEEERGLVGSEAWATEAAARGDQIVTVFNYEMIGYFTDEPNTQDLPVGLDLLFPDEAAEIVADDYRGDFVAVVSDEESHAALALMDGLADGMGLDLLGLEVPESMLTSPALGDLHRSDHASFWFQGFPAMMITDTSEFRYDAYHCRAGDDVVANLDSEFSRKIVATTVGAAGELAGWSPR